MFVEQIDEEQILDDSTNLMVLAKPLHEGAEDDDAPTESEV